MSEGDPGEEAAGDGDAAAVDGETAAPTSETAAAGTGEESTVDAVATLLADETVRAILTETSSRPMAASELTEHCDASQPTIYRRLEDLRELDLVVEQTRPDPDRGHHRQVYAPTLDHVRVDLEPGRLAARIVRREDMADRFTRLVEGM